MLAYFFFPFDTGVITLKKLFVCPVLGTLYFF